MKLVQVSARGREAHVARDRYGGARLVAAAIGGLCGLLAVFVHLLHDPLADGLSPVGLYALAGGWGFVAAWKALGLSLGGGVARAVIGGLMTVALGVFGFAVMFGMNEVAKGLGVRVYKDTKHVAEIALIRASEVVDALQGSPALAVLAGFALGAPVLCEGLHKLWRWRGAEAM
ncbi:MAG: hypothetical protein AAGI51_01390 [Pseudomonadota bacterium]